MSEYMAVLVLSLLVPFAFSFYPPLGLYRKPKALVSTLTLIVLIFGSWDVFATLRGHWSFAPAKVWGIRVVNLPLEEVLFFAVIPFCCIFTWEALGYILKKIR